MKKRVFYALSLLGAAFVFVGNVLPVSAAGSNWSHELMVYSLEQYGNGTNFCTNDTYHWKHDILVADEYDPYYGLWDKLYTDCGTGNECAKATDSVRRRNSSVTRDSMISSTNGWPDADMVFFYGHNTMMQPQWNTDFTAWFPIDPDNFFWCEWEVDPWTIWGTSQFPYWYHPSGAISDASFYNSSSVFYAYPFHTSVLVGKDFTGVSGPSWDGGDKLGQNGELEWVIANGCNALTVAEYENTGVTCTSSSANCGSTEGCWIPESGGTVKKCHKPEASDFGVHAWAKSWGKVHLVMGHNHGTTTGQLPNLTNFGQDLKTGVKIKQAYFDRHTCSAWGRDVPADGSTQCKPSAMSVSSMSCCTFIWLGSFGYWSCPVDGCAGNYMNNDKWYPATEADTVDVSGSFYYMTAWEVHEYP